MGRPPRIQIAGGVYHVCSRGSNRMAIFVDVVDRSVLLAGLDYVARRYQWRCLAYCLLGNHYHLLVQTPEPNLSAGMRLLNSLYAAHFNARHRRTNQVFGERFRSRLVVREAHLMRLLKYFAENPVHAGLCAAPEYWPHSSYAATLGLVRAPRLLDLGALAALLSASRRQLPTICRSIVGDDSPPMPDEELVAIEY